MYDTLRQSTTSSYQLLEANSLDKHSGLLTRIGTMGTTQIGFE
jgi:hypothetical protein